MVIYPDLAFLLNGLADLLALGATAKLSGLPLRWRRLFIAAAAGGVYGMLCLFPPMAAVSGPLFQGVAAAMLIWIAFGNSGFFLRLLLLFWLLSCTLGGLFLAADDIIAKGFQSEILKTLNWKVFLLVGGTCYLLLSVVFKGSARHVLQRQLYPCSVMFRGRKASFIALLDTGHTLTDGTSGGAVLIAESGALRDLWTEEEAEVMSHLCEKGPIWGVEQLASSGKFRLLPYRAVGVSAGLLLCFRSSQVTIGSKIYPNVTVAVSPTPVSDGGGYCALWGGTEGGMGNAA